MFKNDKAIDYCGQTTTNNNAQQNILSLQTDIESILYHFDDRPDLTVTKMMRESILFNRALMICGRAQETGHQSNALLSLNIRILDCLTGGLRDFDKAKDYI